MKVSLVNIPEGRNATDLSPGDLFYLGASTTYGMRTENAAGVASVVIFATIKDGPVHIGVAPAVGCGGGEGVTKALGTLSVTRSAGFASLNDEQHAALAIAGSEAFIVLEQSDQPTHYLAIASGDLLDRLPAGARFYSGWQLDLHGESDGVKLRVFRA